MKVDQFVSLSKNVMMHLRNFLTQYYVKISFLKSLSLKEKKSTYLSVLWIYSNSVSSISNKKFDIAIVPGGVIIRKWEIMRPYLLVTEEIKQEAKKGGK